MKKKIIVAAVAAIVAVGAAWNLNQANENKVLSDLDLSSVEALASESDGGISCNCGLIWGRGCKADNYGATCASNTSLCYYSNNNCSRL